MNEKTYISEEELITQMSPPMWLIVLISIIFIILLVFVLCYQQYNCDSSEGEGLRSYKPCNSWVRFPPVALMNRDCSSHYLGKSLADLSMSERCCPYCRNNNVPIPGMPNTKGKYIVRLKDGRCPNCGYEETKTDYFDPSSFFFFF